MTEKKTEHQYYKGFPERLRREVEGDGWKFAFRFGCLVFVLSWGAVALAILLSFLAEKSLSSFLWFSFFGAIFLWLAKGLWEAWFGPDPGPSILPYFQKISGVMELAPSGIQDLGGIDTYTHGYAIARNCQALDTMARELNLRELSDFGFNDDFRGEHPTWHPAEAGLSTITVMLQELRRKGTPWEKSLDKPEEVIADLERVEAALCKARDKGVPFCFILQTTHFTNALEHERRLGSFF